MEWLIGFERFQNPKFMVWKGDDELYKNILIALRKMIQAKQPVTDITKRLENREGILHEQQT